jgi:Tol biopolymer transport system component
MSAVGAPGVTNLTSGESNDLWPNLDSDARPRLFYQSMIDTRPDPRIFSTQLGTVSRTDLTPQAGTQPRINPKNDTILFSAVNEKTGKRDLYRMTDRGGAAENLTNTPDIDEFDAVWNKDGTRIAFVSDRGVDQDQRNNLDIWVMDLARPDQPTQITTNASHDDSPAWDPSGAAIYFRSNRGGAWNIWRVSAR